MSDPIHPGPDLDAAALRSVGWTTDQHGVWLDHNGTRTSRLSVPRPSTTRRDADWLLTLWSSQHSDHRRRRAMIEYVCDVVNVHLFEYHEATRTQIGGWQAMGRDMPHAVAKAIAGWRD